MRHDPRVLDDLDLQDHDMRLVGSKTAREEKFRKRFLEVPKDETLIDYYSCAFNKDYYLQQGAIYITTNFICFRSNIFGQERKLILPTADVRQVVKVNTFRLIPSGIVIVTGNHKYQFESFLNRHAAFNTLKLVTESRIPSMPIKNIRSRQRLRDDVNSTDAGPRRSSRFIKSQSSCSLERQAREDDDKSGENFLRPLSATVMHDYVRVRKHSCVANSNSLISAQPEVAVSVPTKEQMCQTDDLHFPAESTVPRTSTKAQQTFVICIPLRWLILLGCSICVILSFTALVGIKNVLFPPDASPRVGYDGSSFYDHHKHSRIYLHKSHPLDDIVQLLNSVFDASINITNQVQRVLESGNICL